MKVHGTKTMVIAFALMIGLGVVYLSLSPTGFYFVKLAVSEGPGTTPQTYITCYVKATTEKIIGNKVVETQQSKFLQTNPLFSFVDTKTGKEIGRLDSSPKIRCDFPPSVETSKRSMTLRAADLILTVYSKDDNNNKIQTHEDRKITSGTSMPDNKEITLTTFSISPDKIADDLPE